jgi:DNA-binding beta-propeller fold protein YncE
VTNLQNSGTTSVTGGIDVVNLATAPPIKSSTASVSSLTASLTGIVYDPGDPLTFPATPSVFYAASTMANAIYSFNPDSGSVQTVRVGINPFSVAYNPQTGTLLTINSTSNSSSIVDAQTFNTENTLGISSLSQFAVAVDPMTNTALIVDQNNNRVLGLALP